MYYYTILCRVAGESNAIPFHSIPSATLPLAAPFHSISFHFIPFATLPLAIAYAIPLHSIRYATARGSISFHSIPFHSIPFATLPLAAPFHSISFHPLRYRSRSLTRLAMRAYIYRILRHCVCITTTSRIRRKQDIFQCSSVNMKLARFLQ